MTHGYDPKSCNALEKPFYRPVEAALRWCGLIAHEGEILSALHDGRDIPKTGQFPMWPCLQANTERILDAIANGDIQHGRDGKTVATGEPVRPDRVTVRHTDLKAWMAEHYPDQKPAFLFDEIERKTHAAISADAFRALQADRDAARAELEKAKAWAAETIREMDAMRGERDSLRAMVEKASAPGGRSEKTYLNIIGGLLALMLGKSPSGKSQSSFENQGAVISAMLAHYGHIKGMGDSNLEKIMADANKTLKESAISGG
ncbi:ATP-binding protein [Thauera phenylacetica]